MVVALLDSSISDGSSELSLEEVGSDPRGRASGLALGDKDIGDTEDGLEGQEVIEGFRERVTCRIGVKRMEGPKHTQCRSGTSGQCLTKAEQDRPNWVIKDI